MGTLPYFFRRNHFWVPGDLKWDLFSYAVIAYELICPSMDFQRLYGNRYFNWKIIEESDYFWFNTRLQKLLEDLTRFGTIPYSNQLEEQILNVLNDTKFILKYDHLFVENIKSNYVPGDNPHDFNAYFYEGNEKDETD